MTGKELQDSIQAAINTSITQSRQKLAESEAMRKQADTLLQESIRLDGQAVGMTLVLNTMKAEEAKEQELAEQSPEEQEFRERLAEQVETEYAGESES